MIHTMINSITNIRIVGIYIRRIKVHPYNTILLQHGLIIIFFIINTVSDKQFLSFTVLHCFQAKIIMQGHAIAAR